MTALLTFIGAGVCLVLSSNLLVRSLTRLSRLIRLSEFAISFILVAFATSLPELMVAISSAAKGSSSLALGLAIGSNIVDLSLILGITIVVAGKIGVKTILEKMDTVYMTVIAVLVLLLCGDGEVSRADGMILLLGYGLYLWNLFHGRRFSSQSGTRMQAKKSLLQLMLFLFSIVGLLISAETLVHSTGQLAVSLNVPLVLIGFILVAFGTSLPELAFELRAIRRNHKSLALGDLIGSVVTNFALVIGISSIISPISISSVLILRSSMVFLVIVVVLFNVFMYSRKQLSRNEGIVLITVYFCYLAAQFIIERMS